MDGVGGEAARFVPPPPQKKMRLGGGKEAIIAYSITVNVLRVEM